MHTSINLPMKNQFGCYEMRLESIGGLGANLCGKILGELGALYLDLNSVSFASYGSEKKGSPVTGYIRYAGKDQEIRINSPVKEPHILALFHERMAGSASVVAGVNEHSKTIVNTSKKPEDAQALLHLHGGTLYCVDALKIAMECKSRINMVMLGAIVKASGFIPLAALEQVIEDTIGQKYPAALESNINGIRQGFQHANEWPVPKNAYPYIPFTEQKRDWGYDNAPIGGVNPLFGSTVSNDLSASREGYIPVFKKESCINCGLCDTTCPDMVFQFVPGEYKGKPAMVNLGPDYHHCKGCLRCTEICPTDALTEGIEWEHDLSRTHVRNQDLVPDRMDFEVTGSSSWVESESETVNETY